MYPHSPLFLNPVSGWKARYYGMTVIPLVSKIPNGVLYSLKRSVLDVSAMRDANPDSVPKPGEKVPEKKEEHTVMQSSLAQIAQRERLRRTGTARVFTNEDLAK